MADDTDTTRPGEAAAVEAARLALLDIDGCGWDEDPDEVSARAAVAAAYPVIAAAVREQAAQDIEATDTPPRWWDWGDDHPCFGTGLELAAYIARGGR